MKATDAPGGPAAAVSYAVVRLTADEAPGAALRVAGLTVLEQSIKQLRRMGHQVVVAVPAALAAGLTWPVEAPVERQDLPEPPAAQAAALGALAARLGPRVPVLPANVVRPHNRDLAEGITVTDEPSRRAAEDAIFDELRRGDLGLVARYLNKPVSFRLTRYLLCRLPITPNQVTLGAAVVGLAGAVIVALGRPLSFPVGLLLAHVQSILDGCDGELARVRFQQSAIGEWLDTIVDDALNFCLVLAMGVGLWRLEGRPAYLAAGAVGAGMLLFYNAVAYRELLRQGQGGEVLKIRWWWSGGQEQKAVLGSARPTLGSRLMTLGRRDFFILAWLLLALLALPRAALGYGLVLAVGSFIAASGQLLWRRRSR